MLHWSAFLKSVVVVPDILIRPSLILTLLRANHVLTLKVKKKAGEQVRAEFLQMRAESTESLWPFGAQLQEKRVHSLQRVIPGEDLVAFLQGEHTIVHQVWEHPAHVQAPQDPLFVTPGDLRELLGPPLLFSPSRWLAVIEPRPGPCLCCPGTWRARERAPSRSRQLRGLRGHHPHRTGICRPTHPTVWRDCRSSGRGGGASD